MKVQNKTLQSKVKQIKRKRELSIIQNEVAQLKEQLSLLEQNRAAVLRSGKLEDAVISVNTNVGLFKRMAKAYIASQQHLLSNNSLEDVKEIDVNTDVNTDVTLEEIDITLVDVTFIK